MFYGVSYNWVHEVFNTMISDLKIWLKTEKEKNQVLYLIWIHKEKFSHTHSIFDWLKLGHIDNKLAVEKLLETPSSSRMYQTTLGWVEILKGLKTFSHISLTQPETVHSSHSPSSVPPDHVQYRISCTNLRKDIGKENGRSERMVRNGNGKGRLPVCFKTGPPCGLHYTLCILCEIPLAVLFGIITKKMCLGKFRA